MNAVVTSAKEERNDSDAPSIFFRTSWQLDDDAMELSSDPGIVSEEDQEGIFMQLEEDEGLLPPGLDVLCDNISTKGDISDEEVHKILPSSLSSHQNEDLVVPSTPDSNGIYYSSCGISPMIDHQARLEATVQTLTESMIRSQESRRSLYADLTSMKSYLRIGCVVSVLQSVEFSTYHVDSFCKTIKTNCTS